MDLNCNCMGVATAAKVPVKRYNLLVPDIYPVVEPDVHKPLSSSVERKIKKLSEYLERNEHRAPKVSRRLARRLNRDLAARNYGYVKLGVQAYTYLLHASRPELSSLFAMEIVVKSAAKRRRDMFCRKLAPDYAGEGALGSVVGVLLLSTSVEMRVLGVELLTDFIRLQTSSDYVTQLEGFVPLLCANANPKVPYQGGPAPRPDDRSLLQAACLRALLEHLRFCARLAYVSHHLDAVTYCVLDTIDFAGAPEGGGSGGGQLLEAASKAKRKALESGGVAAVSLSKTSIGAAVGVSAPQVSALLVFEELSHITRDAAEGKKVLEFLMRYLDSSPQRWLGGAVLEVGIGIMRQACAEEHQRYLLYSSLMRHVARAGLSPEQQVAVLQQAVQDGLLLEQALAAPALLLALKELPTLLQPPEAAAEVHNLANERARPAAPSAGAAPASQQQVELAERRFAGPAETGAAALRGAVLGALGQLASCLGEAGPLLEVVASTVSRLAGPQGASTATLECCIAAAEALQSMPEEARVLAGHHFPQLLLQELMMVMVTWDLPQRLLAHRLLLLLLPAVGDGLKEWQARALLSTIWHEAALEANPPAVFVALDTCFAALLSASPAAALGQAWQLAASLQLEVAAGGGRLAALPDAACCALLVLCKSMLQQLAVTLSHPPLAACAVPGCDEVFSSLTATPSGLELAAANGLSSRPGSQRGSMDGGLSAGPSVLTAYASAHSVLPAGEVESGVAAAAGVVFTAEEEERAAAFLQGWRAGGGVQRQADCFREALAGVALLRQPGGAGLGMDFKPLPVAFLAPRMKVGGMFGSGVSSHGGSNGSFESKWVQRVRELYRNIPAMQDATQGLQDMIEASIPAMGGAPTTPAPAALSQQYLDALQQQPLAGQSADDVLSEIDSSLAVMEQQVARGRSPEAPGMLALD